MQAARSKIQLQERKAALLREAPEESGLGCLGCSKRRLPLRAAQNFLSTRLYTSDSEVCTTLGS